MTKPLLSANNLYRTHFPYGMKKMSSGKYLIFNREYFPLGTRTSDQKRVSIHDDKNISADYLLNLEIPPMVLNQLSIDPEPKPDLIFFYNDATNPMNGGDALKSYLGRLDLLMKLKCW